MVVPRAAWGAAAGARGIFAGIDQDLPAVVEGDERGEALAHVVEANAELTGAARGRRGCVGRPY